jgi:lysine 2,3-aminomutase
LADAGLIAPERLPALERVAAQYAVAITPAMAELIDRPTRAIRSPASSCPATAELVAPRREPDPIGDEAHSAGRRHRPPLSRPRAAEDPPTPARSIAGSASAARWWARRGKDALTAAELDAAFAYIAGRPAIWEVIVTGGDPLVLSPRRLRDMMERPGAIEHVKVVRFHTRVPAVEPGRRSPALVAALKHAAARRSGWRCTPTTPAS